MAVTVEDWSAVLHAHNRWTPPGEMKTAGGQWYGQYRPKQKGFEGGQYVSDTGEVEKGVELKVAPQQPHCSNRAFRFVILMKFDAHQQRSATCALPKSTQPDEQPTRTKTRRLVVHVRE